MPSKTPGINFRLPWLRKRYEGKANKVAQAVLSNPEIKDWLIKGRCPVCHELISDCEYMRSHLDNDQDVVVARAS